MLRTTSLIIAAALIAASSTSAFAQTEVSARVSTAGLNLTNQRDQRILQLRINRAAASLCDVANERFGVSVRKAQHACRDEAVRTAMAGVEAQSGVKLAAR